MAMRGLREEIGRGFAWSGTAETGGARLLVSALGLAGPIGVGAALGHLDLGTTAALGSLALSSGETGAPEGRLAGLAGTFAATGAAMLLGLGIAGHGLASGAALVALAGLAAVIGAFSRPMVVASTQFIVFLTIAVHLQAGGTSPAVMLALFAGGAAWTAALAGIAAAMTGSPPPDAAAAAPPPTFQQKLRRWRGTLGQFNAWRYPLRLSLCLAAAELIAWLWPEHHTYWIALTAALVVRRQRGDLLARTLQRGLGTALGVIGTGALLFWQLPAWALAAALGLLAGLRPLVRAGSYLVYSALMTPLVMLIMDLGRPPSIETLIDRLLATAAGAMMALAASRLVPDGPAAATRPGG